MIKTGSMFFHSVKGADPMQLARLGMVLLMTMEGHLVVSPLPKSEVSEAFKITTEEGEPVATIRLNGPLVDSLMGNAAGIVARTARTDGEQAEFFGDQDLLAESLGSGGKSS